MRARLAKAGGTWGVVLGEVFRTWTTMAIAVPVQVVTLLLLDLDETWNVVAVGFLMMIGLFLVTYVVMSLALFLSAPHHELVRWAQRQRKATFLGRYVWLTQPGGGVALYFAVAALVTALLVLPNASTLAGTEARAWIAGGTVVMVFAGWLAVSVTYAIDYFVTHRQSEPDALVFPGTDDPPFSDYLYLAIGMTAAYSPPGVGVRSSVIRRRMTLQMLIGFVFATVTLATVVGLALSQLG